MHWSLLRLCRVAPELPLRHDIEAHFDLHFSAEKVARELAYASAAGRAGFERPYGWAWLLKLQSELDAHAAAGPLPGAARWAETLRPLSAFFVQRFLAFIGGSHYPVRAGTHASSAFAMRLALDYAAAAGDSALQAAIVETARRWFESDTAYPAHYEPSGSDFLSPGLCEAVLMHKVLGPGFSGWWDRFVPPREGIARWLAPALVGDRADAQLVHLDGLNLSRAWCLQTLARTLPQHAAEFELAAQHHWQAAWPHVFGGDFVATHWLLSFALLSLDRE
jgi:hypothetical protein